MAFNWGGTIPFDEFDDSVDEWGNPLSGIPRDMLEDELMHPRQKQVLPHIWEGELPQQQEPLPDFIPNYKPPSPRQKAWGGLMDPLQGIQVPPTTPPFVQDRTGETPQQVPQQKTSGWRNAMGKVANLVGDAVQGAATPNIAGGGATDVLRSMSGAAGARRQREEYEQKRRDSAEQRKILLEDRKRKIEYDIAEQKRKEAEAKRQEKVAESTISLHERQEEAARKAAEAAERKGEYDHLQVTPNGVYNKKTGELKPWPEKAVAGDMLKAFNDMKAIYAQTGNEKDNPMSEANQKLLRDKYLSPKQDMSRTPFETLTDPNATPEQKAFAKEFIEDQRKHEAAMVTRRAAAEAANFNPRDISAMTDDYGKLRQQLNSDLTTIQKEANDRIMKLEDVAPKERDAKRKEIDKWMTDQGTAVRQKAKEDEARLDAMWGKVGTSKKTGILPAPAATPPAAAVPAAATPKAAAPTTPTRRFGRDKRTGQRILLELVNGQWQPAKQQ